MNHANRKSRDSLAQRKKKKEMSSEIDGGNKNLTGYRLAVGLFGKSKRRTDSGELPKLTRIRAGRLHENTPKTVLHFQASNAPTICSCFRMLEKSYLSPDSERIFTIFSVSEQRVDR